MLPHACPPAHPLCCRVHHQPPHLPCPELPPSCSVSFIIYLTDPDEGWTEEDGGLLELYPNMPGARRLCASWEGFRASSGEASAAGRGGAGRGGEGGARAGLVPGGLRTGMGCMVAAGVRLGGAGVSGSPGALERSPPRAGLWSPCRLG